MRHSNFGGIYKAALNTDPAGEPSRAREFWEDTTAIYTEVSIKQLQEVHARCHPSAKLQNEASVPPANQAA